MINIMYVRENDKFYNTLFFFGNDENDLEIIREQIDAAGDIYTLDNYPLICTNHIQKFNIFNEYKYFFFRVLNDVDNETHKVEYTDIIELVTLLINKNKDISKFSKHEMSYVRLISQGVTSGKFDKFSFGKLFLETHDGV